MSTLSATRRREEAAARVERQLGGGHVVAAVLVAQEALAAARRPLHRPAEALRGPEHQHQLRIDAAAHAEAAADLARDHAHLPLGHAEDLLGEDGPEPVRALDAGVQRVAAGAAVELADRGARLHRRGGHARHHEVEPRDVRGAREGARHRVARAGLPDEGHVVGRLVPDRRRAAARGARGARHRGQGLVVDGHQLRGVGGRFRRRGHHERDRIAHVADALADQRGARGGERGRAVAALARAVGRQVAEAVGREIGAGEHREHAGRASAAAGSMPRMRACACGRAQHHRVGLARQAHVVGVAAEPLDEARVLEARDGLAHREFLDGDRVAHGGGPLLCHAGGRRANHP